MGFSRQEYWSGMPFPLPGDLPDPGIEPMSLISPALASGFFTTTATWEAPHYIVCVLYYVLEMVSIKTQKQFPKEWPQNNTNRIPWKLVTGKFSDLTLDL